MGFLLEHISHGFIGFYESINVCLWVCVMER